MCAGNPEWEDELELEPSDVFDANDGNGVGSEISLKKHKAAIKKNPNRLICIRRNVYTGATNELSEEEITADAFWEDFEPVDDMERSAFIIEE